MSAVFISYRRDDSSGHTGRIYDHLRDEFGKDFVFRDIDAIEPGTDFVEAVENGIKGCSTLIVIIGDQWLTAMDENGHRLDDPNDFVRIEVASAIRKKLRIIPVLVKGAAMPSASDLPEEISALARRHALELSDSRWDYDIGRLIATLSAVKSAEEKHKKNVATPDVSPVSKIKSGNKALTIFAMVGFLLAAAFLWLYFLTTESQKEIKKPPPVTGDSVTNESGAAGSSLEERSAEETPVQQPSLEEIKPVEEIREVESTPQITDHQILLQQQIEELLAEAQTDFASQRFTSPSGSNAFEKYQQILRLVPGNSQAENGLRSIAVKYLRLAQSALRKGKFKGANYYLELAQKVDPDVPGIEQARKKIRVAQEKERDKRALVVKPKSKPTVPDQNWQPEPIKLKPEPAPKPTPNQVVPVIQNTVENVATPKAASNEAEVRLCLENCKNENNACLKKSRLETESCTASIKPQCEKARDDCEGDPSIAALWGELGAASECLGVWHQCKDDKAGQCEQLQDESAADCDSSYSACQQRCR